MNGGNNTECSKDGNNMDCKVWEMFQKSFCQVQTILDQNRILIIEINQNQESKVPENLARNVSLIRELNANIARVVKVYANLSTEFVQSMMEESAGKGEANRMVKMDRGGFNSHSHEAQKKPRLT